MKNKKQINKVSKEQCLDAIDYFWECANLDDENNDAMHYTKILMKKVANDYKIKLEGI